VLQQSQRLRREPNSHECIHMPGACYTFGADCKARGAMRLLGVGRRRGVPRLLLPWPARFGSSGRPARESLPSYAFAARNENKLVGIAPGSTRCWSARSGKHFAWARWRICRSQTERHMRTNPVLPNPSLEWTRYGRRCKLGLRHMVHYLSPSLQRLPPRAPQLER
jgi:hypothetical protein